MPSKNPEVWARASKKYNDLHREEIREKDKKKYWANVEERRAKGKRDYWANKESRAIYIKQYRITHAQEIEAARKKWYEENKEEISKRRKLQRALNPKPIRKAKDPEKATEACLRASKHRAIKRGRQAETIPIKVWNDIKRIYRNRCAYCGRLMKRLEMDHIIPLSRGGTHTKDNIIPACASCNRTKAFNQAPSFQPILLGLL